MTEETKTLRLNRVTRNAVRYVEDPALNEDLPELIGSLCVRKWFLPAEIAKMRQGDYEEDEHTIKVTVVW